MIKQKTEPIICKREVNEIFGDKDFINPHVKLVKVCWNDANTNRDNLWLRDVFKQGLIKAETIGYLLYETDDWIAVCGSWFWDGETDILDENGESVFKDVHIIPKSQINTILVLKTDFEEREQLGNRRMKTIKYYAGDKLKCI